MVTEEQDYSTVWAPIRVIGYRKPELFTYWGANTAHSLPKSRIIQQFGHQYESLVTQNLNHSPIGVPIRPIGYRGAGLFNSLGTNTGHWLPKA
ncbi:hypothetical protein BGM25_10745 [Bacillus sp. FJAT-29953]|nr:hypothetical protein [Bacillus sp. FJAT-29953]